MNALRDTFNKHMSHALLIIECFWFATVSIPMHDNEYGNDYGAWWQPVEPNDHGRALHAQMMPGSVVSFLLDAQ